MTRDRGKTIPPELAPYVMAGVHPLSILRAPDSRKRQRQRKELVSDLKRVAALLVKNKPRANFAALVSSEFLNASQP